MISDQMDVPFGYMKCSYERQPKILTANNSMMRMIGASREEKDWNSFVKNNIYLLIPFEYRDCFAAYLERAIQGENPVNIEHEMEKRDGSRINVSGWLQVWEENGEKVFQFFYLHADDPKNTSLAQKNTYLNALKSAYKIIFEINTSEHLVSCIYIHNRNRIGKLFGVGMETNKAIDYWVSSYVVPEDRDNVRKYIDRVRQPRMIHNSESPLQVEFRLDYHNGTVRNYVAVAVEMNRYTILLCCRDITEAKQTQSLTEQNAILQKLTDHVEAVSVQKGLGAFVFRKRGTKIELIYVTKALYEFYGLTEKDYADLQKDYIDTQELLQKLGIQERKYEELLLDHDTEMTVFSEKLMLEKRIHIEAKQLCEDKSVFDCMVYDIDTYTEAEEYLLNRPSHIYIRTFDYFDVFVDGKVVCFSNDKEKELLALLVDRNGGTVSAAEAASLLWEEEVYSDKIMARYRKLAMNLRNTLRKYEIEHIIISNHGIRCIDTNAVECDYYGLIKGQRKYRKQFHDTYMSEYSWAEKTLGHLLILTEK